MLFTKKIFIMVIFFTSSIAQNISIIGTVLDETTLEPIKHVNILVKDTDFGTVSNDDGRFTILTKKSFPVTLIITHIGYLTKEITIQNNNNIEVLLSLKVLQGQDVIIEGVQRHSEREVASKIEVVELKSIEKRGIRDIGEVLNEFESVNVNTTSYGKQTVSIRGSNPNEVAVYIDGIKLNNSATGSADIAYVDLTDLSEVEVIKGGSSTLFGAGNFGGVVLLHSQKPQNNSLEYSRSFGLTDKNDQDITFAGNIKLGSLGAYGRYSGKSRLYDGRTLFTTVFGNYGGLLSFDNQEISYKHVDFDKFIEYPSGGIVSSDELKVERVTFFGNIFGTSGWDIQYGKKVWTWDDNFYTNITRLFADDVEQYRINKGFKINSFSGSIQVEDEKQIYNGDQLVNDSYSDKSWKSKGELIHHDRGIATVLRYDIQNPEKYFNLLRFEGGFRYSNTKYSQDQINQEFDKQVEREYVEYKFKETIPLTTYKLSMLAEGEINNYFYKIFFGQGYNNRLPTLNDRFIWADGINQLEEDYRRLKTTYNTIGNINDIQKQMSKIKSVIEIMEPGLEKEFLSTTEFNGQVLINDINDLFKKIELSGGLFRNYFINKIAYFKLDNDLVVPYNTNTAWLNGAELSSKISLLNDDIILKGSIMWIQPSDQEIFPNKPSTSGNILLDINKNWFHLNISHIFNGPQYYLHGGVSYEQLQKQQNTNLTISAAANIWLFETTFSYSIRNIFSNDVTIITAGAQSGDIFNYYDAHRELFNIKISLSDKAL